jgi:hypothetical protein
MRMKHRAARSKHAGVQNTRGSERTNGLPLSKKAEGLP